MERGWLHDLPVLVLGLGDSWLAMARWCARAGAQVQVWDSRADPPQAAALARDVPAAVRIAELPLLLAARGIRLVLKSPGLAPADARIAPLLADARAAGIAVLGELDLFVRALDDLRRARGYAPQVLAITGTNGKTTTTALTALLVARAGRRVGVAGNIGPTLLDTLDAADRDDALPAVWVLELSSFQLDEVQAFEPDAAVVLNVSQDHLDWHGTMASYAAAKARVFGARGVVVVNRDDPVVAAMADALRDAPKDKGRVRKPPRTVVRFGLDAPRAPGDFGVVTEHGIAWLVRALPGDDGPRRKADAGAGADDGAGLHLQRLMPADALRLRGRHNAANALAALALATAIGCPLAPMLHGLREYEGEPHRVQLIARVPVGGGDVEAYDDSKGTNVGATVAALAGLGAEKAPGKLVVILGGDGKGQDFAPLAGPIARHARAVATIGRDAASIEAAIEAAIDGVRDGSTDAVALRRHATLDDAVAWCFAQAHPGDAVLLSPACASFDMFRGYAHRAAVFADAVQTLAAEKGCV